MAKKMKNLLSILFLSICVFGFTACGRTTVPKNPTHTQTVNGDFSLTISTGVTTFKRGKNIVVEIAFENLTEQKYEVHHARPMIVPFIVKSSHYQNIALSVADNSVIDQYEEIIVVTAMGKFLSRGKHELVAIASFTLVDSSEEIRVVSNTIILTIK